MKRKDSKGSCMPTEGERAIWTFYKWGVILTPFLIMLSHWGIFYAFSLNNKEVMNYPEENEFCIAWMYSLLYLYIPLMILPASYFFRWCNLFRIPFVYFIFINVERWYYGSWFCTNEMVDTHYILIYCIICVYVMEILEIILRHRKNIAHYIRLRYCFIRFKMSRAYRIRKAKDDEMCDKIIKLMEEENI